MIDLEEIKLQFNQNIELHKSSIDVLVPNIAKAAEAVIDAYKKGNKVLLCGNGGSAADAQHIAAELVGRFKKERKGLPAIALNVNTSVITAIANDFGYDLLFSRQIESLGNKGDILIIISTSGISANIIRAIETAKERGITTIGLLGKGGGKAKDLVIIPIVVPSDETDRIQEIHILIGHILCSQIDNKFSNI